MAPSFWNIKICNCCVDFMDLTKSRFSGFQNIGQNCSLVVYLTKSSKMSQKMNFYKKPFRTLSDVILAKLFDLGTQKIVFVLLWVLYRKIKIFIQWVPYKIPSNFRRRKLILPNEPQNDSRIIFGCPNRDQGPKITPTVILKCICKSRQKSWNFIFFKDIAY